MDAARWKRDFPILQQSSHGRPLVYLDSAATSQKPTCVIDAEADFYRSINANVHRGVYELSERATDAYEGARETTARFLNARDPSEVIFLRGATEGLNLAAGSLGRKLHRGDRVVTTIMEHHSNIVPWHFLRTHQGIDLQFLDIDGQGELRLDQLDELLTPATKVVTVTHVSNVLGTVNPIWEIADRAHAVGATVVVDAAQSVPHRKVDVQALGADLVTFSGHKALGPTGIGALWGRRELLERMEPWMGGGEMIQEVHTDRIAYREPPARFEAGTPNAAGAVGLARALQYLESVGWDELRAHEEDLARYGYEQAIERFGDRLTLFGPPPGPNREAVLSFSLRGTHPHDVASLADAEGVAIRSGHHCAQPLMERLKVPALSRASPYLYNDRSDLDRLFDALVKVEKVFA
jgi:cysteine desulfurase/selenocysteine lyase